MTAPLASGSEAKRPEEDHLDSSDGGQDPAEGLAGGANGVVEGTGKTKKKKKKKAKSKHALPPLSWDDPLVRVSPFNVLDQHNLYIFRTSGCRFTLKTSSSRSRRTSLPVNCPETPSDTLKNEPFGNVSGEKDVSEATPVARQPGRLILRAVELDDEGGIQRIKCEPMVQKTQLYGNPRPGEIKRTFLLMYILNDMPSIRAALIPADPRGKRQFTFALSLSPSGAELVTPLPPPPALRASHALRDEKTGGYIGNIALQLEASPASDSHNPWAPTAGTLWTWPTRTDTRSTRLRGKMFYELHPQLWRMGLMREAVEEVVRFGFEELSMEEISVDPTEGNVGSIKLATDLGFAFQKRVHTEAKPQLWHVLTRATYIARNGEARPELAWAGKTVCRWCLVYHGAEPAVRCEACAWGRWCSAECRRADWLYDKGHRAAGGCARKQKEAK